LNKQNLSAQIKQTRHLVKLCSKLGGSEVDNDGDTTKIAIDLLQIAY
jgi:hypothetical protein